MPIKKVEHESGYIVIVDENGQKTMIPTGAFIDLEARVDECYVNACLVAVTS